MAIQAITSPATDPQIPTLRSVIVPEPEAKPRRPRSIVQELSNPLDIERVLTRSVHVIADRYSQNLGTGVLFYKKHLGDIDGYLYFGLLGSCKEFKSGQLELVLPNNSRVPIFLLNVAGRFDHESITLFAFESNRRFDTIKLIKESNITNVDEYYFSGFQEDKSFNWDNAEEDNVDYYPISDTMQKVFAHSLELMPYQTYSYENAFHGWSRAPEELCCSDEALVLRGMCFKNTLAGGAVVNSQGRLKGLLNEDVNGQLCVVTDIRPIIPELKRHMASVIKRHKSRQYRIG